MKCTSAYRAIAHLPICVAAHAKSMLRQMRACVRQGSSARAAKSRALLHIVNCPVAKPFWNEVKRFCNKIFDTPSRTNTPLMVILNRWDGAHAIGPEGARAFVRHAFGRYYATSVNHAKAKTEKEPFPFDMPKTFFDTVTRYKEAVMREGKDLEKFKAKRMHTATEKKHVPATALERFAQLMDIDPDTYKATLTPDFTAEIGRAKQMVDAIRAHRAQGGQHRDRTTVHANPRPQPPARWAGGEQGTPPAAPPIAFRQGRGLGRWGRQTSPLARPARQALDEDDTTHPAAPRNEGAAGSGYGDRS
jgi:hypothetical protein